MEDIENLVLSLEDVADGIAVMRRALEPNPDIDNHMSETETMGCIKLLHSFEEKIRTQAEAIAQLDEKLEAT